MARKSLGGKALEEKNVNDYFKLAMKIIKKGNISKRERAHVATMFQDAAFNCMPKNKNIDAMYNKLLDQSIKRKDVS